LSTHARRRRCIEELARIVKPGGLINIQAWAMEQEEGSRRKFASNDVFVPFNAQPKYLRLTDDSEQHGPALSNGDSMMDQSKSKSTAEVYSEAFNADYDERKGLVVFKRYCHLYREGEIEQIVADIPNVSLVESGYESGNHFVILRVSGLMLFC